MKKLLALASAVAIVAGAATAYAVNNHFFSVRKQRLKGEEHAKVELMKHRAIGLRGFSLGYSDKGDRKVGALGFWPRGDRFYSVLKDKDANDAYDVSADFAKLPLTGAGRRRVAKKRNCTKQCRLRMTKDRYDKDMVFILSGFKLTRVGKRETNIKQVKIRPNYAGLYIDVAFNNGGNVKFDAEVTYFLMPRAAFTKVGTVNGAKTKRSTGPISLNLKQQGQGPLLLRGFDIRYSRGNHHLKKLIIGAATPTVPMRVYLGDKSRKNRIEAVVDYAQVDAKWTKKQPR